METKGNLHKKISPMIIDDSSFYANPIISDDQFNLSWFPTLIDTY